MPPTPSKARRSLARIRRSRQGQPAGDPAGDAPKALAPASAGVGWDADAERSFESRRAPVQDDAPLAARILSLLSDPRVSTITVGAAAASLAEPKADVQTTLDALVQAGELICSKGPNARYGVTPERKAQLEALFRDAAQELGETTALVRAYEEQSLARVDDDEEPRLPVTAGLLSLFLPGTGQLLNGDVGRASLVFAVWSLALLTHLSPIWTFVALYAGAEAFFTAKIRSMERKLALEAGPPTKKPQPLKPA
jgi:hypothetical protein